MAKGFFYHFQKHVKRSFNPNHLTKMSVKTISRGAEDILAETPYINFLILLRENILR